MLKGTVNFHHQIRKKVIGFIKLDPINTFDCAEKLIFT